jgi:biotin-dependent carboxylase-like uncharacterized protein
MIEVLSSSFGLSIQDLGRFGYAGFGLPCSGAMDQYAAKLANKVLNNAEDAAVLEITNGGCKLVFKANTCICLTGADYSAKCNEESIELNKLVQVKDGTLLSFAKRKFGFRTYLAVKNGVKTKTILNSRSQYKGITSTPVLQKGDVLHIDAPVADEKSASAKVKVELEHFTSTELSCYKGPEFDLLNKTQQQQIQDNSFKISMNNSRMGYQLEQKIENTLSQMLTSSVLPGTVQLTPSGKLIILMRDCQVTGGYPRVLQLSEFSINRLAQKTTDESIQFNIIDR